MKEETNKNKEIVESIVHQIWRCTDILRGSLMNNNLHVLLFLVSAYKDQMFTFYKYQNHSDWYDHFCKNIYNDSFYRKIYDVYSSSLKNIHTRQLEEVFICIGEIDTYRLEQNFEKVFEVLLKKLIDFQGKRSGESVQPKEISRLIIKLANLKSNAKVYNPFAGLASFGVYLNDNQEYHGQEINASTWAIGQLRLKAHNKRFSSSYKLDNSIENWNEFQKFDLIVATPPFKMRIQSFFNSNLTGESYKEVESFLIDKGIHSLSNNGKLITVFPLSFLFSGGRLARLKKTLIDNDIIDTVIILPSGLLSNTSIPVCIIIFSNVARKPGYIKLVEASSFFSKDGPRNKILKDEKIKELIYDDKENHFLRYVSTEEVYKNDFDLSVGRYFLRDIQGAKLNSFSKIIKGSKAPINTSMKRVQIRNLKEDIFNNVLTSDELEKTLIKRGAFRLIEESCLLLATRWNTLKPTFFKYTGEPIVISLSVIALKLNERMIDPTFLINEFSADYVQEQVASYRVGSVQPMLKIKDLENIVFQLPSMEEQKAKVSGIIELSKRLRKIESEKENILSGILKEETESSTSLSHILGKPLLSIGSSIEIIQNALSKLEPEWKNYMISQNRQFSLSDAFDSISKNVKYIQELADKNTSLVSVSNFELNELHFLKFISQFVKDERKSLNSNITIELDIHEDIKEQKDNQVLIKGNSQKLRIVLINLLQNAKDHAFSDNKKTNKINIEILPFTGNELEASSLNYDIDGRKSYMEVRVSNTGVSFPKDFKLKDYVRKNFASGITRNNGLGGYEVNEILKAHNEGKSALNIVSNKKDSEYSSVVSFVIPII